jgi:hypothetical protein
MITKNIAAFCAAFESEMAHKSIEETIADMCHETSVEISNAFGYEI